MSKAEEAVTLDEKGQKQQALTAYTEAVQMLQHSAKYEYASIPRVQQHLKDKVHNYITRAEELDAELRGESPPGLDGSADGTTAGGQAAPSNADNASNAYKPKGSRSESDSDEKSKLRDGLSSVILTEKPEVSWDDVAGLESAKDALKEAVILPVKFPQFFTGKRKTWSGFLLYGPPGTGKSYLAKAVATEADSTFFSVSSSALLSKWMGESEKLVSQLFAMAREKAPSIIFIDEIDSLCGQRGGQGESEAARRIKTEILVQMQGVTADDGNVLVLAATNTPYSLDHAVRRRFDRRIYIPLPDAAARARVFKVHVGDTPHNLNERDFKQLGELTEGYSGSDIASLVKDVLFQPVRKTQDATHFKWTHRNRSELGGTKGDDDEKEVMLEPCSPGDPEAFEASLDTLDQAGYAKHVAPPPITKHDFERALVRARPTVSAEDVKAYDDFTNEFGESGEL